MDNITKWISESYNNKFLSTDSCLLITGNSGVGKTHIIYKIIEDLDLFVINIDINNCSTSEEFIDFIIKSISSSLIQILTNNNKKKIILIN